MVIEGKKKTKIKFIWQFAPPPKKKKEKKSRFTMLILYNNKIYHDKKKIKRKCFERLVASSWPVLSIKWFRPSATGVVFFLNIFYKTCSTLTIKGTHKWKENASTILKLNQISKFDDRSWSRNWDFFNKIRFLSQIHTRNSTLIVMQINTKYGSYPCMHL